MLGLVGLVSKIVCKAAYKIESVVQDMKARQLFKQSKVGVCYWHMCCSIMELLWRVTDR